MRPLHRSTSAPHSPLRRVSRLAAALLVAVAATASAQPSVSQAIDVQHYKPGPGAYDVLGVHGARIAPHLSWNLGTSLSYADDSLNLVDPRAGRFLYRIIDSQLTLDLMGAIALFDRVELGVSLPVSHTTSEPAAAVAPDLANGAGTTGVGDLRLVPKVRLLSTKGGIHLAVAAAVTLPTAGGSKFLGSEAVTFQPRFVAEWATPSVRLLANAGFNFRREERLRNLRVGHELTYAVGAEVPLTEKMTAQATLAGALGLKETGSEERPLEALAALKYRVVDGLAAHAGAGPGLSRGYGTPSFRVLAGLAWTPATSRAAPPPSDALGSKNLDGFQDDDGDGIPDVTDVCPHEPETFNGFQDEDGCPDDPNAHQPPALEGTPAVPPAPLVLPLAPKDTDGDGIIDSEDVCPNEPEDFDGFEDEDGCPDPDNDQDGIPDTVDQCPLEAETINGVKDDDGCPDVGKAQVRVEGARIVILDKVYFATGKDEILPRSFSLLRQVAATLRAHPQLLRVHVEGHTDSQGDEAKNLDLSQRRAKNVTAFLVKEGIAEERLEAVGYGETRPVDSNATEQGRENNRRVEFNIVKVAEPSAGGGTR